MGIAGDSLLASFPWQQLKCSCWRIPGTPVLAFAWQSQLPWVALRLLTVVLSASSPCAKFNIFRVFLESSTGFLYVK